MISSLAARSDSKSRRSRAVTAASRNATLTSSLCSNDRLSMLVVPMTAHAPSTISALTCVIAGRYS